MTVSKITTSQVLQTVGGLLITISLALATWGATELGELSDGQAKNSERLTAIESSRVRAADVKEVWEEIASIREGMAKLPPDQTDEVKELGRALIRVTAALDAVKPADVLREVSELRAEVRELRQALEKGAGR